MKTLYTFEVSREEEVDEVVETTNEAGAVVKTTTKVKKQVPKSFAIKKPNRALTDEAELFYGVNLANSISAGMMSAKVLERRLKAAGGIFSDEQLKDREETTQKFFALQKELAQLAEDKTKADSPKFTDKFKEFVQLRQKLQQFQLEEQDYYEHTAEARARNKTMGWWVLNLAYDGEKPFFGEGNYETRMKVYDSISEGDDEFLKKVVQKFFYLVSFWSSGKASTKEEFDVVFNSLKDN